MAKEYIDPKVKQVVKDMIELLETRYHAYCQPNRGSLFVITEDGMDGGDIRSNGKYEYDFHKSVSFLTQSREEIIKILDEYFEV